jgi:hypothetical protein
MNVWIKAHWHLREGSWVVDGFDVRNYPFEDAVECEMANLASFLTANWHPKPKKLPEALPEG